MKFAAIGQDLPVFRLRYELAGGGQEVRFIQGVDEADARLWLTTRNPRPVARILSCAEASDFEARINTVWFTGTVQEAAL